LEAAATPLRSWEYVEGWGMAVGAHSRVLRPRSVEEIAACFRAAREQGLCLGLRGTGNSYGDASVNRQGWVLDVSRMNRILSWDPVTGVAVLEPGVTVQQLWKHILRDGWWPAVVSGTAFPTVAGALAMNIHGKNNYKVGPIGDHCLEFDLVLPSGEVVTASRERNADLFHAAIGGFGMLGAFSRVVLRTKHVHSGEMRVQALRSRDLAEMMRQIEALKAQADYLVGWVDAFPGRRARRPRPRARGLPPQAGRGTPLPSARSRSATRSCPAASSASPRARSGASCGCSTTTRGCASSTRPSTWRAAPRPRRTPTCRATRPSPSCSTTCPTTSSPSAPSPGGAG
jgi:FAD/FMN-containing dehydrogenase